MFYTLFTQPLLNALFFFVWLAPGHNLGVAIVALTIGLRLALWPLYALSRRSQETFKRLQPKLAEIKTRFPGAKEKQLQATLALYREEKVNPLALTLGNFLLLAVQLPILFALFRLFSKGVTTELIGGLYFFVPRVTSFSTTFFGLVDLARPNVFLAVGAGAAQFFQARATSRQNAPASGGETNFGALFQKQAQYLFPVLTIVIALRLPSAIALYWLVFTALGLIDDLWSTRKKRFSSIPSSPRAVASSAS